MKIVSSRKMRDLDQAAIKKHGIASLTLMERAGKAVADEAQSTGATSVAIICGHGNNGGDGLVAARHLLEKGIGVRVILLAGQHDLSPDALANFELLAPLTPHIYTVTSEQEFNSVSFHIANTSLIIDAIFGTGLDREVSGLPLYAINFMNSLKIPKIAIDVPSGLSADTGLPLKTAVRAKTTVTLGLPKPGFFFGKGADFAGEIKIADIGLPQDEITKIDSKLALIEPSIFSSCFAERKKDTHKGTYGHAVIFAGALGHLGAGYLSSLAALRSGVGLVTYCLPEKAFTRFDAKYPEIMCEMIPDAGTSHFHPDGLKKALDVVEKKSVVVIGPAIGTEKTTGEFVNSFLQKLNLPVVIDADALNVLDLKTMKPRRALTILTPHPGEMARLQNTTIDKIQTNRIESAIQLAQTCGAIVVLKGHQTIVATKDGTASINPTGNPGMATAGMGDALTGIIASFIAQGMDGYTACCAAVFIHGLAGDLAARERTERALITSDVIGKLGDAFKLL